MLGKIFDLRPGRYVIDMQWLRRCGRRHCRGGASHCVGKSIFGIVSFAALEPLGVPGMA
jgi:hypothetical protein